MTTVSIGIASVTLRNVWHQLRARHGSTRWRIAPVRCAVSTAAHRLAEGRHPSSG